MALRDGLVAYWPMDEDSGSVVSDVVGGRNGTATGTSIVDGKKGKGRLLNDSTTGQYITVTGMPTLNTWTVSVWIYHTLSFSTYEDVVSSYISGGEYYPLMLYNGRPGSYNINNFSPEVLTNNQWHHIVTSFDGTAHKVYVNGDLKATKAVANRPILINIMGRNRSSASEWYKGVLDDVMVWDRALSDAEVYQLYTIGGGLLIERFLVQSGTIIKTYDSVIGDWVDVGTSPVDQNMFDLYGMETINVVPAHKWNELPDTFDLLSWTDDVDRIIPYRYQMDVKPFRPIMLLSPNTVNVLKWTNEPGLSDQRQVIKGERYAAYRYKVEMEDPLTTLKGWSDWIYGDISDSVVVESRYLTSANPYTIKVTVEQLNGTIVQASGKVTLIDTEPTLVATMTGNKLDVTIGDPEGDDVRFKVLLNGVKVHPADPSKEFTDLETPTVTYSRVFRSNEVILGGTNTVTIVAQDQFGKESTVTLNFIGEYAGLLFSDEQGNLYSTDLGEVLMYLDIGVLAAGQISDTYPVRLVNRTGNRVGNIQLWRDNKTLPTGAVVEISETASPFVPVDLLSFNQILDYNEEVTFYVRVVTTFGSPPGQGEFDVYAQGDPV